MCIAFFTVCAWISLPFSISFSFQIFGIFLVSSIFGVYISAPSVIGYILLGIIGLPVFSAFTAGFSALAGAGGGYIIGFLISAFIISAFSRFYQDSAALHATVMMLSLVACYICGSVWYAFIFNHSNTIPFWNVLLICVLPYIIPDVLKIFLVLIIYKKLNPYFKRLCAKL
jgi:biotin transport system substrate-specific component